MIPPRADRFFAALRTGLLGPTLSQDEVSGCSAILQACKAWPVSWTAYALATAYHETAHTMQPVREYGGEAYFARMYDPKGLRPEVAQRLGNVEPGDGAKFCGRGYVQVTGRANYQRAENELGHPLCGAPDMALRADIAAEIMERGMREAWFTGKGLAHYLPKKGPASKAQFTSARRVINGTDRAELIADYASRFQAALIAGGC